MTLKDRLRQQAFHDLKNLQYYPPFLFMGVKIPEISPDHRFLHATLPLRWYARNLQGTQFGGFMAAVADPLPALLCWKLFPGTEAWTQRNAVEFKRPGRGLLHFRITIDESTVQSMRENLARDGKCSHTFAFDITDDENNVIASVQNTAFLKNIALR